MALLFQIGTLYFNSYLLALEVRCKVNPQMIYTRNFFWTFSAVYLTAAVVGALHEHRNDGEVLCFDQNTILLTLYLLLFGRLILCLSLAVYNEYHRVNFHGLEAPEAIPMPTEERTSTAI